MPFIEIMLYCRKSIFVSVFTFCLLFYTMVVKLQLTLVSVSPHLFFILCPILLAIAFLFGLTVPQQFIVSVHKSSTNSVDKKNKTAKNVRQSASAVVLLCHYLAIVIHREEIQRDDISVCISGSVIAIHILSL
jgi:hypothetical protein